MMAWLIGSALILSFGLFPGSLRGVWFGSYIIAVVAGAALAAGIAGKAWRDKAMTVKSALALILLLTLVSPLVHTPVVRTGFSLFAWGYLSAFLWLSVVHARRAEVPSDRPQLIERVEGALGVAVFVLTYYLARFVSARVQRSDTPASHLISLAAALGAVVCLEGAFILVQKEVSKNEKAVNLILLAELAVLMWAVAANLGHL